MPELTASATAPLTVIGCFIFIAVIIARFIFASKRKYKQKVDAVTAKTKQLVADLDELFKPVKKTCKKMSTTSLLQSKMPLMTQSNSSKPVVGSKKLLNATGIYAFLERIKPDSIQASLVENSNNG